MAFFRRSKRAAEAGWIEQSPKGGWDVVFPDGERLVGISSLAIASELALAPVEDSITATAGPKFDPPVRGTRSPWMPEGAEEMALADSGRWLRSGSEISVKNEPGRFIVRWIKGDEVTVFGGRSGHEAWRTFRMDDIRRVHTKQKLRGNQSEASFRLGHQMADPTVVAHCPFCGSGDVIARSDGSVECVFCSRYFSISEQPQYASLPGAQGPLIDEGFDGEEPVDMVQEVLNEAPSFVAPQPNAPQKSVPQEGMDENAIAKGSVLRTSTGALLDEESYALHLALKYGEREAVLASRRARFLRSQSGV